MKALVTGNLGFVGRHFLAELESRGYSVEVADIRGDNPLDCREGFRNDYWTNVDLVVHCAATIPPIDQRHANDLLVANDLSIDAEMFQWALRTRPRQVVYFSSSAAYPAHLQEPHMETKLIESDIRLGFPNLPDAMYGWTKLTGEMQAQVARKCGLKVLVVRPFSGYGSDQSEDYPFRAMIERAKRREPVFDVWGNGRQVRDFIHIDDIVDGVMAWLDSYKPGPVNIGTGIPVSMMQLAQEIIRQVPRYKPKIRTVDWKPTGTFYRVCNPNYFNMVYKPKVSLAEGIERALASR